jgi:hypothetical protein
MNFKHLVLAFFATLSVAQAADGGLSLGAFGGIHGGAINNFSVEAGTQGKEGLIGIGYGWQAGVDLMAGPIWVKPFYQASNTFAADYSQTPAVDNRYTNNQAYFPVMYRISKNNVNLGVGAFYAMPMDDSAIHDSGMAFAMNVPLAGGKASAGFHMMGGFRDNAQGGTALNFGLNIGFKFK